VHLLDRQWADRPSGSVLTCTVVLLVTINSRYCVAAYGNSLTKVTATDEPGTTLRGPVIA